MELVNELILLKCQSLTQYAFASRESRTLNPRPRNNVTREGETVLRTEATKERVLGLHTRRTNLRAPRNALSPVWDKSRAAVRAICDFLGCREVSVWLMHPPPRHESIVLVFFLSISISKTIFYRTRNTAAEFIITVQSFRSSRKSKGSPRQKEKERLAWVNLVFKFGYTDND